MIKKRYIFIPLVVIAIGVIVIGALAYILFARTAESTEIVFAPTEVGTPVGDKVTKDIGPAGGTLVSPDGRLTLTVPEDTLAETIAFSIQPVTNKFGGGLGPAYKLEPDTKTFTTPLEISVHYDDHDLEGTFPEALSLAYQDDKGAWHMQKEIDLDKDKKTITIATAHFSIWAFDSELKVSPVKAMVRVGQKVSLSLTHCDEGLISSGLSKIVDLLDRLINGESHPCKPGLWLQYDRWQLVGEGEIAYADPLLTYTAPGKKPSPNIATVVFYQDNFLIRVERPCTNADWGIRGKNDQKIFIPKKCYKVVPGPESVQSVITIIGRGYRASGSDGPTSYSGTVCSLDKEFTVIGHNGPLDLTFKFTPSGDGRAGTGTLGGSVSVATWIGDGPYTIEGFDSEKPKIVWVTDQTVSGKISGRGTFHIDLVPLDTDECGGG